jgi:hypothetical protein
MTLEILDEAIAVKEKLVVLIAKYKHEDAIEVLENLNICIDAILIENSRRHMEVLLPKVLEKAKTIINSYR